MFFWFKWEKENLLLKFTDFSKYYQKLGAAKANKVWMSLVIGYENSLFCVWHKLGIVIPSLPYYSQSTYLLDAAYSLCKGSPPMKWSSWAVFSSWWLSQISQKQLISTLYIFHWREVITTNCVYKDSKYHQMALISSGTQTTELGL